MMREGQHAQFLVRVDRTFCMILAQSRCSINRYTVDEGMDLRCSSVSLTAAGSLHRGVVQTTGTGWGLSLAAVTLYLL